jgi:hypothetical protein
MVIETNRKFWAVTDAREMSEIGDVCFQTSLGELGLQVRRGGLDPRAEHLTIYDTREEALHDANKRLADVKVRNFLDALREVENHLAEAEDFIPEELREELRLAGVMLGDIVTERMEAFIASKK